MTEKSVTFTSAGLSMEALLEERDGDAGVVVCHPHPQFGGDMRNSVVDALVEAYGDKGYTTLRFNFRGMGKSQGSHDNGVGETDDLVEAAGYLKGLGKSRVHLAGYSFGSWICALAAPGLDHPPMAWVAPPVNMLKFPQTTMPGLHTVVVGQQDHFAPPETVEKLMPVWNRSAGLSVIAGTDHFFMACADRLAATLALSIPAP
ncbi:MAG: alpha/beta hydrolase [Desulfatibacillaceae bacterium]